MKVSAHKKIVLLYFYSMLNIKIILFDKINK